MRQPEGFVEPRKEHLVCCLNKPLYGAMQAGHIWYNTLGQSFEELGYQQSEADPCVRVREVGDEYTLMSTYTDDVFGALLTHEGVKKAKQEIAQRWEISDAEDYELFLGVTVDIDEKIGDTSISQRPYFECVLQFFGLWDLPPKSTSFPPGLTLQQA